MVDLFDIVAARAFPRLDVPKLRTLFGTKQRPRQLRQNGSPVLEAVIETPAYDLTWFTIRFGLLSLKAYTKGEHVLRLEAVVHNTRELGIGRVLERFPEIVAQLSGMVDRFATSLDCVDIAFLPDRTLDDLPCSSQLGATRVAGVDLNKPRIRAVLAAALALAAAPAGFTVAELTSKVHTMTGQTDYTTPGRLRPAQAAWQAVRGQARAHPALPRPTRRRPHHRRPPDPARRGDRSDSRRRPQPPARTQARDLDLHRPALRDPAHRHAAPLRRPRAHGRHACGRIDNFLSITETQAPRSQPPGLIHPPS